MVAGWVDHVEGHGQEKVTNEHGERCVHDRLRRRPTHADGTFAPPVYLEPGRFVVTEGLLAFHTQALREMFDVRVYLDPPEDLRRHWKVQRDCSRRGYTTDQVLAELDRREPDSEQYIRPQRHHADLVVSFQPPDPTACNTSTGVTTAAINGGIGLEG